MKMRMPWVLGALLFVVAGCFSAEIDPQAQAQASASVVYVDHYQHLATPADHSPAIYAAINAVGPRGGDVVFGASVYLVPNGIIENKRGLRLIGSGHPYIGPGGVSPTGTVIQATSAGAWAWVHKNNGPTNSNYGIQIENMVFAGDGDTAGGLWVQTNNNAYLNVWYVNHTHPDAAGLQLGVDPASGANDASWHNIQGGGALNSYTGMRTLLTNSGGELANWVTLKTSSVGIQGQGVGVELNSSNWSVVGGKHEQNAVGMWIRAGNGVTVTGTRSEKNGIGFKLDRPKALSHASRIILTGCQATGLTSQVPWYVGPYNREDKIIGFASWIGVPINQGVGTMVY